MMLAGFTSRWTRRRSAAAASAAVICSAISIRRQRIERPEAEHALLQRFAFDHFHRVKALAGLFANPEWVNGGDARVTQRCCRARLPHKPLSRLGAANRVIVCFPG